MKSIKVTKPEDGMRLDRFLHQKTGAPVIWLHKAMRKGQIKLVGKKCDGATRVEAGMYVQLYVDPPASDAPQKQRGALTKQEVELAQHWVLYRDEHILVIDKPAGLATQGGSKLTQHLDRLLPALQFEAAEPPRLAHRLDKDTSGVLLLARTVQAARELQHLFAQKKLQKIYLALVSGVPIPREGEIESRMQKEADDAGFESMQSGQGKKALTRYRVLDHLAKTAALVELEPITGRTHQLRVHCAELGCPIYGDSKYGSRDATHAAGLPAKLQLHAYQLQLPAMFGHKSRMIEAAIPEHMKQAMQQLGLSR
jgi:23S rRNA pseudouridine955/2504/2580 synthase